MRQCLSHFSRSAFKFRTGRISSDKCFTKVCTIGVDIFTHNSVCKGVIPMVFWIVLFSTSLIFQRLLDHYDWTFVSMLIKFMMYIRCDEMVSDSPGPNNLLIPNFLASVIILLGIPKRERKKIEFESWSLGMSASLMVTVDNTSQRSQLKQYMFVTFGCDYQRS